MARAALLFALVLPVACGREEPDSVIVDQIAVSFRGAHPKVTAVHAGLAWKCFDDGTLLDEAKRLAKRASVAPREMVAKLKATCLAMGAVDDHDEAVDLELEAQLWSVGEPAFRDRLAALKRRIAKKKS